jgi:hypothetical protein
MDSPRQRLRALAGGQDGQFATAQARALGVTTGQLRSWRRTGEIALVRRGVWRFTISTGHGGPAVTAFLLCWPHGVVSHRSAGRFHGLDRLREPALPEVLMPLSSCRRPAGVRVHVTRALPREDVLAVGGLRYTSLARTVIDLANAADPWETLSILDDAVALGARPRWIDQRAAALSNGRGGVALLRESTSPGAPGAFRSWLERVSACVYRAASIPEPEWNAPVHDSEGLIGLVDALWRRWFVIAEQEGLRFHTTPRQRRSDARRFNRLCDCGYAPRRFTWADVVHRPVEVAATVQRALRAAGADLDPATIPREIVVPALPFAA